MSRLPHVELTERGIAIDGRDISGSVFAVDLHLSVDGPPLVQVHHHAESIRFNGPAEVWHTPYDGIERLRARLAAGTIS